MNSDPCEYSKESDEDDVEQGVRGEIEVVLLYIVKAENNVKQG